MNIVESIAGENALKIYDYIKGKENVSEFKIAEKLDISVNQVRNSLYKLQKYNLVSSIRKKDKEKGWYIYYWTFSDTKAEGVDLKFKKERLANLKEQLNFEDEGNLFSCPKKHIRIRFEDAMEINFKCSECGKLLKEENNSKAIKAIKKEIDALNAEIYNKEEAKV